MSKEQCWGRTYDGKEINVFDPDPALFTVARIAHALARINRFAGHWVRPISVARHSIRVAELLRRDGHNVEIQLWGLFHDAAEAFTTDIPSPLKPLLFVATPFREGYRDYCDYYEFEEALLYHIFTALEISWPVSPIVHRVDKKLMDLECGWVRGNDLDLYRGCSMDPDVAARCFTSAASTLFAERQCAK